jgi:hypothetical protein
LREEAKKGYAPLKYEPGNWVKVKWLRYPQLVVEVTPEGYYRVWDEWEIKWHEVSLEDIERPVKPDPKASTGSPEEMASRIVDVKELLESLKRGHERKKKVKIRYATSEMGGVYIVNVDGEEFTARDVPSLVHSLLGYGVPSDEIEKRLVDIKTLGFGEELTIDPNLAEKEVERARELAIWRRRGVVEPVRWVDVASAFQEHYRKVKDALVKAAGGYENIERIKEYPAEPFEAYYKIAITLKNPITAEFRLLDTDVLEFNGQQLPLYIDEKAYTPFRLRLFRYFVPEAETEKLQREIQTLKFVKTTIKDFYVQVDNPAWWSRAEEKFVPRPSIFGFLIYE